MDWNPRNVYYYYDKPVPYWSFSIKETERTDENRIMIYPAIMENYLKFHQYASCLMVEKNTDTSLPIEEKIKLISMSYLDYLFYETIKSPDEKPYLFLLDRLFSMVLKDEKSFNNMSESMSRYNVDENGKCFFIINDTRYGANDLNEIKKIICEQNSIELPDERMSKELRDKIQEAEDLRRKLNNTKMGSLEVQMVCVMISTAMKLDDIYRLPIRKFVKILERVDQKLHYSIYLSAAMSGMVEFKNKDILSHWMSEKEKTAFENNELLDYEKFKSEKGL